MAPSDRSGRTNADNINAWSRASYQELDAFGDHGDFARQHLLTPTLLDLLGNVEGKAVLDGGAGNGYLARLLARKGAQVTAVEPAHGPFQYIAARETQAPLGITCLQQDLSTLDQLAGQFDFVVANMVLLDIPDFRPAIANCISALRPGGAFIFSLEHPFTDVAGRGQLPFPVSDYFTERALPRTHGDNYHRTLETYIDAVADCGGLIERIKEPRLAADIAAQHPEHAWASKLPAFMVVLARPASS